MQHLLRNMKLVQRAFQFRRILVNLSCRALSIAPALRTACSATFSPGSVLTQKARRFDRVLRVHGKPERLLYEYCCSSFSCLPASSTTV